MIEIPFGAAEAWAIAPFTVIALFAMGILLYETFRTDDHGPELTFWFSILGLAGAAIASLLAWDNGSVAFGGTFATDGVAVFTNLICILAAGLSLMMGVHYMELIRVRAREFQPLVLFAVSGMFIMGGARDLIVLFLGIEVMSIPAYVLAGIHRQDHASGEAALKYFLLGAFATSFLLYGIALVYGATGTTTYAGISMALSTAPHLALLGGIALLIVALGFKVGVVPFHFWAPDVYQGAPTAVTALMAVGIKAAAVVGTARLFLSGFAGMHVEWSIVLWWISVATMTLGNVVAIVQSNVKRMLAYSSVAHAGYLIAAIASGTPRGGGAILFYLLAYAFMNLGAFAVVIAVGAKDEPNEKMSDFAGLATRRPLLSGAMALFLLSLMGIPPLVGFVGKLYIIEALIAAGQVGLGVIVILNSVVSGYYYLRVIIEMFMKDATREIPALDPRPYLMVCVAIALAGTIFFGIFPDLALEAARDSFAALR
ncbi:MAG: NADH-quinone oxidoreductase subunit N [Deltaproteobacteria bacterium]|nr:NADH-quinone oxidoreductase subunit N [Deltaproteobacteria bacterium]